jgi:hypothetical protein
MATTKDFLRPKPGTFSWPLTLDGLHSLRLPGMARGLLQQREHPDYKVKPP